jgi:hypothetical protein
VLAKGIMLFAVAELGFYAMHPDLASLNVYGPAAAKRERFSVSTHAPDDNAQDLGDLDAMLASHLVSEPKAPNEYRVFILGDSGVWGDLLPVGQTLTARLNGLQLACGAKKMRFYDLSYPQSSTTKDLMILDRAMAYQPDQIVWALTLYTVMPRSRTDHWLIRQNPDELFRLDSRFHFLPATYPRPTPWTAFQAQQVALFHVLRYDLYSLAYDATGLDQINPAQPDSVTRTLTRDLVFQGMSPPRVGPKDLSVDEVADGYRIAGGVPMLLFNEPILNETGAPNNDLQYNAYYPRWVYDQYRQILRQAAARQGWNYLDLWNAFPAAYFSNTPLHLVPQGETQLAGMLAPAILDQCSSAH